MNQCIGFCGSSKSPCLSCVVANEQCCQTHIYMKNYTPDMVNNLTYRKCCRSWMYTLHHCERCAQKLIEYRQKKKLKEQKCFSDGCTNVAKNEGYCGRHDNERLRIKIVNQGFKTCQVPSCLEKLVPDYPFKKCRKHLDEDNYQDRQKYAKNKSKDAHDLFINENGGENIHEKQYTHLKYPILNPTITPIKLVETSGMLKEEHSDGISFDKSNQTKQKIKINHKLVTPIQLRYANGIPGNTIYHCSSNDSQNKISKDKIPINPKPSVPSYIDPSKHQSTISVSNYIPSSTSYSTNTTKSNSQRQKEYVERKKKEMGTEAYNTMVAEKKRVQREKAKKKN